jgi:hypothetical protein
MDRRRKAGLVVFSVALIIAFSIPFVFKSPSLSAPEGNNGNDGGGNGRTQQKDTESPQTMLTIVTRTLFFRGSIPYFYPSFTLSLQATDNASLSMIILNDTGTPTVFHVDGTTVEVSLTVGSMGLHTLQYHSVDVAGNKETAHNKHAAIARPELTDLIEAIDKSNIDNDGIRNALKAKVGAAQHQLAMGHELHSLNALVNQLQALEEKHALDSETVRILTDMISLVGP